MRAIKQFLFLIGLGLAALIPSPNQAAPDPCSISGFAAHFVNIKPADLQAGAYAFAGYDLEPSRIQNFVRLCPAHNLDAEKLIQNLNEQTEYMKKSLAYVSEIRVSTPASGNGFSREEIISGPDAIQLYSQKYIKDAITSAKRP